MSATPWLASACPAAVDAQIKLLARERGSAVFGLRADALSHGTTAYTPVLTDLSWGDEQTTRTANGGVQGPQYAWRQPVIT